MDSIITLISLLGLVFKSQFLHWFGLVFCVLFICYRFISMTRKKEQDIGIKAYFSELSNLVLVLIFNIFCLTLLYWWDFSRRRNFFRNQLQSSLDDAIFIRTWQSARFPICESEKLSVYHRVVHKVLTRCFPQPCISDAPWWCNFYLLSFIKIHQFLPL